ncbi:hypothetical protein FW774_18605 [Pedobacter sp. BS3]|uniref:hypothetical protein n=1 Tax=Pedobacter sp. BS3 TaxID=2567937 RepID=UPI0011EE67D2|nr:hypothetical protein [Pedobacter sp. BS3]TZF81285.1 hypothetical protein FW774_18605 [Pedobacter sp. BS3]
MNLKKYVAGFAGFTILLIGGILLVQHIVGEAFFIPKFWVVFGFIAVTTLIASLGALQGIKRSGDLSVYIILGATTIKLLLCMGLAVFYLLNFKVKGMIFAADFFSVYLLFTAFEVYTILHNLRHQNKT